MDSNQCLAGTSRLELTVIPEGSHHLYSEPPWKVFGPIAHGDSGVFPDWPSDPPVYYLTNMTAGILAGDKLEGQIHLQKNTAAHIIAPAATRIFSMPGGSEARQKIHFSLAAGSRLDYYANQIIPYAGANFSQTNEYWLDPTASLAAMEFFTPGRMAAGERFAFYRLELRNRIVYGETLILDDRLNIKPSNPNELPDGTDGTLSIRRPVIGTVYLAGPVTHQIRLEKCPGIPFTGFTQPHPQLIIGRSIQSSVQEAENTLRRSLKNMSHERKVLL
jgi:urease accessory protein UreH